MFALQLESKFSGVRTNLIYKCSEKRGVVWLQKWFSNFFRCDAPVIKTMLSKFYLVVSQHVMKKRKINEETKYQKEQMAYQLVIWFKSNVTCELVYFCQDRGTMGESLKLPPSFLFLRLFVIDI